MDAGTILRAAREATGTSQRGLARALGVPQPNISDLERGAADATVGRLDRLLRPLGGQVAALPTTAPTIADWAGTIASALSDEDHAAARIAFVRLADWLASIAPDLQVALCVHPPASTGHRGFDAALASTVEYLLGRAVLPVPRWAREVPSAPSPLYLVPNPAIRSLVEDETPDVFRRRNVFVTADFFASA